MKYECILVRIKAALELLYPPHKSYVSPLADLLKISQKSVRRKLSGETPFTIFEISEIAKFHSISLSEILDSKRNGLKHPMQLFVWDYSKPEEFKFVMQKMIDIFTIAAKSEESIFLHTNNFVPYFTLYTNDELFKFMSLKWLYYYKNPEEVMMFSDITIHDAYRKFQHDVLDSIKYINSSKYILHIDFFRNTLNEVLFFYQKGYLKKEEALVLLQEYTKLLDKFKDICEKGFFVFNDKRVDIYFTDLWISNSFTILKSGYINFAAINAHYWDGIASRNHETYDLFKQWFETWLRVSNCVSLSSEKQRFIYINRQRLAIEEAYKALENQIWSI